MNKVLMIEAVGYLSEEHLADYARLQQALQKRKNRNRKSWVIKTLIAAAALVLVMSLLLASVPIAYIVNRDAIDQTVSEVIDSVLFPLDDQEGSVTQEDLLLNWTEWLAAEQLFEALGAGTENSLIEQMQSDQSSQSLQDLGAFLERLYEYYQKYKNELPPELETEQDTTEMEGEDVVDDVQKTVVDEQGVCYELYADGKSYMVIGKEESSQIYDLVIPAQINGIPVKSVADAAFMRSDMIRSVRLPEGLTEIGGEAFSKSSLQSIVLPESLTMIGDGAFKNAQLQSIVIPSNVTVIGEATFAGNRDLVSVEILGPVTYIGKSAFSSCVALQTIALPDTVTIIESNAFSSTGLTEITIPKGVTVIKESTFQFCSDLTRVDLPDGLIEIEKMAFFCCNDLSDVTLPDSIAIIGEQAFYDCSSLQLTKLPASLKELGAGAFMLVTSLVEIEITPVLETIPNETFSNDYQLQTVIIPVSVKSIGEQVFYGCTALQEICYGGTVQEWKEVVIGAQAFDKIERAVVVQCTDGEIIIG